jgi:hypothetical protein
MANSPVQQRDAQAVQVTLGAGTALRELIDVRWDLSQNRAYTSSSRQFVSSELSKKYHQQSPVVHCLPTDAPMVSMPLRPTMLPLQHFLHVKNNDNNFISSSQVYCQDHYTPKGAV